jgi:CubicO group peptidase (beta-lactamase class C family)
MPGSMPLPPASPKEEGFSEERLGRIRPTLQTYIDRGKVPNFVTLVARRGRLVHFDAQGYMDVAARTPVSHDTLFRLYSNTKPIAGVATMILYEEGLLTLDDPISRFIPALGNLRVRVPNQPMLSEPARSEITVRHCLTHTSGLATQAGAPLQYRTLHRDVLQDLGWLDAEPGEGEPYDPRRRVETLAKLPLNFHPGTAWEYHVGYPVMSAVLEIVSGMPLDRFFRERIFEPLGMHDTDFYVDESKLTRFPPCYVPRRDDQDQWTLAVAEEAATSEKILGPKTFFGAGGDRGGVVSTAGDYARFGQMLLNGGELDGVRILGRKSVELMTANHTPGIVSPMTGPGVGFGMGVSVRTGEGALPALRSIGSYGWGGAAGTTYFGDPKEELLCVCFTQVLRHRLIPGNEYGAEFERLVYQALL